MAAVNLRIELSRIGNSIHTGNLNKKDLNKFYAFDDPYFEEII